MRVLLTGAGGFIGSHLCRALVHAGHDVAALSRHDQPWRLQPVLERVRLVRGDLGSLEHCAEAIMDFEPDAVVHAGWQGVAGADRNEAGQVRNICWTADLLECSRRAGARVFLGLGSQAEYGPKNDMIGPADVTAPTTLYGEAKLAAGRIAACLARHSGLRFVWMRVFSLFGPMDHPYWMLPSLIGALLRGERPALTAGEQRWDFLFVEDAVEAIRLALEAETAQGVYVLGSGQAPRLRDTIETIRDVINPGLPLGFGEIPYRPGQIMHLQADISALKRDLGWVPRTELSKALASTVYWYRSNDWIYDRERLAA